MRNTAGHYIDLLSLDHGPSLCMHEKDTHVVCYIGGPAGGNGGSGGNVWVQADDSLNSLTTIRKQVHYRADSGRPGGGSNMTGANAEDLIIKVSYVWALFSFHLLVLLSEVVIIACLHTMRGPDLLRQTVFAVFHASFVKVAVK